MSLTMILAVTYSPFDQYKEGGQLWGKARVVAYETLSRLAFGTGVAWIIFVCVTGNGGKTFFRSLSN